MYESDQVTDLIPVIDLQTDLLLLAVKPTNYWTAKDSILSSLVSEDFDNLV